MKTPRSRLAPLLLPLLGAQGLVACAESKDGDLVIVQAQPVTEEEGSCIGSQDTSISLSRGTVDMAVAQGYVLFPLVQNNIEDIRQVKGYNQRDARLNTKDVLLRRAKITYGTQEEFTVQIQDRTVPLSASVLSQGGQATVAVELLTPAMIRQFRNAKEFIAEVGQGEVRPARTSIDLSVNVTIEGETQDGNEVESNEFNFSLRVCNGCLIFYPPEATGEEGPAPNCLNPPDTEDVSFCGIGQDRAVHCGVCAAFAPDPLARQLCQPAL